MVIVYVYVHMQEDYRRGYIFKKDYLLYLIIIQYSRERRWIILNNYFIEAFSFLSSNFKIAYMAFPCRK